MGTTKLKLFNQALRELGQAKVLATGEAGLNPQALADVYDETLQYCLEQGYWNFAMQTEQLATAGGTALFGRTYPYVKPSSYVRTFLLSTNDTYWPPFEAYEEAKNEIHADVSPLYMAYVSNATDAGLSLSEWPESYTLYVAGELAKRIAKRIGASANEYDELKKRVKDYLTDARSKDALNEGVKYPPEGRFVRARSRGWRSDRGSRGSLTG